MTWKYIRFPACIIITVHYLQHTSEVMPPKTFANAPSEDQGQEVAAPAKVVPAKVKVVKKAQVKAKDNSGNPKFKDMVIDAITTQKERSGSSLAAIKNHLASKYKVDVAKKSGILNRLHQIVLVIPSHSSITSSTYQAVEKDGRRRSSCTWCPAWQERRRMFQALCRGERSHGWRCQGCCEEA